MIKRYNVELNRGGYCVADPETMTSAPMPSQKVAEEASRQLNAGADRTVWFWLDLPA